MNKLFTHIELKNYNEPTWNSEEIIKLGKFRALLYSIEEFRMGTYSCNFCVIEKDDKHHFFNPDFFVWYNGKNTILKIDNEGLFAFRRSSDNGIAFVLIDLIKNRFSVIDWDSTSIYYGLEKKDDGLIVKGIHKKEIKRLSENRTGEVIPFDMLKWNQLDSLT